MISVTLPVYCVFSNQVLPLYAGPFRRSLEWSGYDLRNLYAHQIAIEGSGDYGTPEYYAALLHRFEYMVKAVRQNLGAPIVFCDVDVVFFPGWQDIVLASTGDELRFMDEGKGQPYNFGFQLLGCSERVLDLYEDLRDAYREGLSGFVTDRPVLPPDQALLAQRLSASDLRVSVFPWQSVAAQHVLEEQGVGINAQHLKIYHANLEWNVTGKLAKLDEIWRAVYLASGHHTHPVGELVGRIRDCSNEALASQRGLERLLLQLGLKPGYAPCGSVREIDWMPEFLHRHCDVGLRIWQYPNQLARYLLHVARYDVRSYLEIGTGSGGTLIATVEVLSRFGHLDRACAVDRQISDTLLEYCSLNPKVRTIPRPSQALHTLPSVLESNWDLVFIDGDHERPLDDILLFKDRTRMLALHDICEPSLPAVGEAWQWFRHECAGAFDFFEFTEVYREVESEPVPKWRLGIGLAVRKDVSSPLGSEVVIAQNF